MLLNNYKLNEITNKRPKIFCLKITADINNLECVLRCYIMLLYERKHFWYVVFWRSDIVL